GIYDGDAYVTGVEAAAMMLRALGYTAMPASENWETPVVAKAAEVKLFKDVGAVNGSTFLNRNAVAQVALNALKADVVKTDKEGDIIVEGIVTIPGKITYTKVEDNSVNYNEASAGSNDEKYQQLCEKLYEDDLKLNPNDEDALGRPAHKWTYKANDIITVANEADYTVVLKESPDDMRALLDLAKKNLETTLVAGDIELNGAAITALTDIGAGDVVEFHMDDNDAKKIDAIFVTRYELNKIDSIDDDVDDGDADEGVSCYVDFDGNGGTAINNTDIPGFNAKTYVEGAYVALLVSDDDETIVDSYIPEIVEDSVETRKGSTELTVNGTKYTAAEGLTSSVGDCVAVNTVNPGSDNTYALYLDNNGYVLGVVEIESDSNSIDDVYYLDTVWSSQNGMSTTYHAQLVNLDGTKSEVQLEKMDHTLPDSKNDLSSTTDYSNYNALRGLLVTISDKKTGDSKANNDKYNLKVWAPTEDWDADQITSGNLGELEKDTRSVTNGGTTYRLNGSTVYLFLEKDADDLDVSRYVGGVSYDSTASGALKANQSYVITEKDKTVAKYVIIATNDAGQKTEYSSDVIFIKEASTTQGDGFYSQTVYLPNGREQTWRIDESEYTGGGALASLDDPAFFTYAENDDGYYELDTPDNMTVGSHLDWQDDKPEGVLNGVTFDDENDLFEDMLTVTTGGYTVTDIDVAGAAFKDLHDKDDEDQYDRTVTSLSALAKAIEDAKAGAATLYLNVSKDGAVTIFVTSVTDHAAVAETWSLTGGTFTKSGLTIAVTPAAATVVKGQETTFTVAVSATDASAVTTDAVELTFANAGTITVAPAAGTNCGATAATNKLTITATAASTATSGTFTVTCTPTGNVTVSDGSTPAAHTHSWSAYSLSGSEHVRTCSGTGVCNATDADKKHNPVSGAYVTTDATQHWHACTGTDCTLEADAKENHDAAPSNGSASHVDGNDGTDDTHTWECKCGKTMSASCEGTSSSACAACGYNKDTGKA
ncbi:hypothetical protein AALA54_09695, partial [Oscillospiraceae bacterium 44-34]